MRFGIDRRTFVSGAGAAAVAAVPLTRVNGSSWNGSENAAFASVRNGGVSPRDFGAVGDGTTDDLRAVVAAITHALDNGYPVDGGNLEYGVSGGISVSKRIRPHIDRLHLKQLDPAAGRVTLKFEGCQHIRIDGLDINVGNAAGVGHMDATVGFLIHGGSGHKIRNVTATGNGKLTYVRFWRCKDSTFENIHVHDGVFEDFEMHPDGFRVPDDVVQGIHLADNTNCNLVNPIVRNLTGNATYFNKAMVVKPYANLRTRGIAAGGNTDCTIQNPQISNTDQAIDISGGGTQGNTNVQVIGGHSINCGSVGVKLANSPRRCKVVGHIAENVGMMGFLATGYDTSYKASDCDFIGCTAINPGYNDIHNGSDWEPIAHSGFHVRADTLVGAIEGIRIIGCKAIDAQGFLLAGDDPENGPGVGATSAILKEPWTAPTGSYTATFNTGETRTVTLTSGSTRVTWSGGLERAVTWPFVSLPAKMAYGFLNESGYDPASKKPNTIDSSCESVGHLLAHSKGFHRDVCHVTGGRVQSIPSNRNTAIEFFTEVDDTMGMHSTSSDEERVYLKRPGRYRVEGMISFAPSPSGYRRVQVRKNGIAQQTIPYAAVAGESTACPFNCEVELSAAEIAANGYIDVAGQHTATSGGVGMALNVAADRWLKVELVRPI